MVMEIAAMIRDGGGCGRGRGRGRGRGSLSAIGGVESGEDAAQYLLVGASTVQVCTGVMIHGYGLLHALVRGLTEFMERHGFARIEDFRGRSLDSFTTHAELVRLRGAAKEPARQLALSE
jgi:glutamate synthase domain-containing protein 2